MELGYPKFGIGPEKRPSVSRCRVPERRPSLARRLSDLVTRSNSRSSEEKKAEKEEEDNFGITLEFADENEPGVTQKMEVFAENAEEQAQWLSALRAAASTSKGGSPKGGGGNSSPRPSSTTVPDGESICVHVVLRRPRSIFLWGGRECCETHICCLNHVYGFSAIQTLLCHQTKRFFSIWWTVRRNHLAS